MNLGESFLLKIEGGHLWVVCSLASAVSDGGVLLFNFTTYRLGQDRACVVVPGEHPFVTHETIVAYQHGRLVPPKVQEAFCKHAEPQVQVSPALLTRIQNGALASDFTPDKLKLVVRKSVVAQGPKKAQ